MTGSIGRAPVFGSGYTDNLIVTYTPMSAALSSYLHCMNQNFTDDAIRQVGGILRDTSSSSAMAHVTSKQFPGLSFEVSPGGQGGIAFQPNHAPWTTASPSPWMMAVQNNNRISELDYAWYPTSGCLNPSFTPAFSLCTAPIFPSGAPPAGIPARACPFTIPSSSPGYAIMGADCSNLDPASGLPLCWNGKAPAAPPKICGPNCYNYSACCDSWEQYTYSPTPSSSPSPTPPPAFRMTYTWFQDSSCRSVKGQLVLTGACQSASFNGHNYYGIGVCTSNTAYTLQFYANSYCTQLLPTPAFNPPGVCGSDPLGVGSSGEITCVGRPSGGGGGGESAPLNATYVYMASGLGAVLAIATGCFYYCRRTDAKPRSLELAGGKDNSGYYSAQQQLRTQYMPPQQVNQAMESIQ